MHSPDTLDQQALHRARQYMGAFAWPTVLFAVLVVGAYVATLLLSLSGLLSLWIAAPLMTVLTYLAYTVLLYLFAYLVHRPHEYVGRYVDTCTILAPGPWQRLVTWLWVFQNYHSIHHLFPRVPFYQYVRLFEEIEPIMVTRGAPIYRLTPGGLVASSADSAAAVG